MTVSFNEEPEIAWISVAMISRQLQFFFNLNLLFIHAFCNHGSYFLYSRLKQSLSFHSMTTPEALEDRFVLSLCLCDKITRLLIPRYSMTGLEADFVSFYRTKLHTRYISSIAGQTPGGCGSLPRGYTLFKAIQDQKTLATAQLLEW